MPWTDKSEVQAAQDAVKREIIRRCERGEVYTPFDAPTGTKLARNFWGQAWQQHLATFEHFSGRLSKGRSYLRLGQLYNLEMEPGMVRAEVAGAALYEVAVQVKPMTQERWEQLVVRCTGRVTGMLDLLEGKLSDEVMAVMTGIDAGLFPEAHDVRVVCSCPDHADLCKHGAAVLYAVGLQFDREPAGFFKLRGVRVDDLCQGASVVLEQKNEGAVELPDADLEKLFGIDLGGSTT